jgi:hypothetical protein
MFEFAFEGELLPFIVNGDRFVLLALLPRRKPRTPVSAAAFLCSKNSQPHHLTGTPIPLCALVGGLDFCFNDVAPHLHTMRVIPCLGFTRRKKPRPPHHRDDLGFRFFHPLPPCGGARLSERGFRFRPSLRSGWVNVFAFPCGSPPRFARGRSLRSRVYVFFFVRVTRFARDGRLR